MFKITRISRPKQSSRILPTLLPDNIVTALQNRELNDSNYETLMLLDTPSCQGSIPLHIITSFPLIKFTRLNGSSNGVFLSEDGKCGVCNIKIAYGDIVRQIPCRHGFHQSCIGELNANVNRVLSWFRSMAFAF